MLRRFESINDSSIFERFRWDPGTSDLQRINLVFGTNGAGKTSLARTLDALTGHGEGYRKVSARLSDPDGSNERTTNRQPDDEFKRLFVFIDGYVSRSHRFDEAPEMDAVLTLGEKTVEAETRIGVLRQLIEAKQRERAAAQEAAAKADRELEKVRTAVRNAVVSDLSRAGGDYTSNATYGARIKDRLSGSHAGWALLSGPELASSKQIVTSDARLEVPERTHAVVVRSDFGSEAQALLNTTPVSIVLDTLKVHPGASSWVDAGRHHHERLDTCIFCGSPLSDARKSEIEAHFSDEVTASQSRLDRLIAELQALRQQLDRLLADAPDAGLLFEDLREDYDAAHAEVQRQINLLEEWIRPVVEALEAKRANVLERSNFVVPAAPSVDGSELDALVRTHNERVANHESLVQEASRKVERHHLKSAEARVDELMAAVAEATETRDDADAEVRKYNEEVASLEAVEGDPLPGAQALTREVARLLGRSELVFELAPDGARYRVMRHGQPAEGLSTGERRAITLVHFLENVRNAHLGGGPIVVIDDPVSSLDSNAATGIATYIWNEAVVKSHIEQLVILTHNFELFKQWDLQIDGLHRNPDLRRAFPAQRYELVAPHQVVNGVLRRVPRFVNWPPTGDAKRKLRSTYHHAFITVARAGLALRDNDSLEHRLDGLLLYPNVIRRMLETFLAFKRPQLVGNFTDSMRASASMLTEAGYDGDPEPIRLRLTRFTHAYSHDESPETDVTLNPDEIGPTISAVFTFMDVLDSQHFRGLCEIAELDPADLLLKVEVPSGDADDAVPERATLFGE